MSRDLNKVGPNHQKGFLEPINIGSAVELLLDPIFDARVQGVVT
jgi:hypothetical protein